LNEELFTIESKGLLIESDGPTRNFFEDKNFPKYLQNVRDEPVNPDCSCSTILACKGGLKGCQFSGSTKVNGKGYDVHDVLHTIKIGEVIERELTGVNEHPYHQHVFPFQLTKGFDKKEWEDPRKDATEGGYFQNGDWHDVISSTNQKNVTIKYTPRKVLGKMMLHCHILAHEDEGMIAQEKIVLDQNCSCDSGTMSDEQLSLYSTLMDVLANKNN